MKISERIVNSLLRGLFRILFKVDTSPLKEVMQEGPAIIISNHISIFEGPLLYVFMQPRPLIALAKKELWDKAVTRYLMNIWGSIGVDRENMSRQTLEECFNALDAKNILAIAPEGTRSSNGKLQQGKPGVAYIAHKKGVPLIPIATIGFENFSKNIKRLRRTPITIAVGPPFEIIQKGGRLDAQTREELIDEIMVRLALLMPQELRGYYRDHKGVFKLTGEL
ncbi:MAG: lysophospholipid acyltransferase family protein [Candidatus Pacearchaeota archaeon]|jgi:1-acyl-sn-glycerol-3-phosphate acyltransferase|nr:lysophospholipid acyltransferase family protein [Sphaerochaetaceae bacterium]HHU87831.1 1-acyl-sn-glycerol-3-phosphate acyltransferase [Spirochaetales bacterium]